MCGARRLAVRRRVRALFSDWLLREFSFDNETHRRIRVEDSPLCCSCACRKIAEAGVSRGSRRRFCWGLGGSLHGAILDGRKQWTRACIDTSYEQRLASANGGVRQVQTVLRPGLSLSILARNPTRCLRARFQSAACSPRSCRLSGDCRATNLRNFLGRDCGVVTLQTR
uniref:Uncharacterized protein n=1 Tax=Toxoplasma gondii COUG TaxID=1074873 RepID=A0A2G8XU41_TOXGO|nr:hypothetical protein TGCOUG_394730 [Toxoplasma gondii COUG]